MSTISPQNQFTIPADVLRTAGLEPGDAVHVTAVGPGHIRLTIVDGLIERYAGVMSSDVYPPGYLEDLRQAWR